MKSQRSHLLVLMVQSRSVVNPDEHMEQESPQGLMDYVSPLSERIQGKSA